MAMPSVSRAMRSNVPWRTSAPAEAARSRNQASKYWRSTMPTKPPSMGMSTATWDGAIMRAEFTRATSSDSGISNSSITFGGMAPPHGLMRPLAIKQAHAHPEAGQVRGRRGARRTTADDHDVNRFARDGHCSNARSANAVTSMPST